ncbi:MAG: plasma membrane calcium [Piccolia ochrophora]|nr:MAG: plasma membrane calcium [Piccolia ochrophora]
MTDRLLVPSIAINTNLDDGSPESDASIPEPTPTRSSEAGSFLTVRPPASPTAHSLDGETLGDPSRSRSNSSASQIHQWERIAPEDALKPDRGTEADFVVEDNPFPFAPGHLNKLLNPKSLSAYYALGGIRGLEAGLRTDLVSGLNLSETVLSDKVTFADVTSHTAAEKSTTPHGGQAISNEVAGDASASNRFQSRLRVYKDNTLPEKKPTSIWKLMWLAYKDKILILLSFAALVSLVLGLYETFGRTKKEGEPASVDWVEGLAICIAIIIVVLVGALNDWQKERQFKEDREVKAIRSGTSVLMSVHDVTVGDILHMEPGDVFPADGIFISGHNVKCDESSATGESDQMKKTPGAEAWQHIIAGTAWPKMDPFIISGSKVLEGVGTYLVTSVGVNSSHGKTMMALRQDSEPTPLQVKLFHLAGYIAKLGTGAALLLFTVLLIRFLAGLPGNTSPAADKASTFLDILIVAVTIIVVAVPEGLPLAVTLALAFATTRMLKENNLVRILRACETMGNATTICSDKTGTLTQNKMSVVAGIVGRDTKFAASGEETLEGSKSIEPQILTTRTAVDSLSKRIREILRHSIAINSTAFEGEENGIQTFIGSKTETALLGFARTFLGMGPVAEERASHSVIQLIPFDSGRKCMGAVIKLPDGKYRLLVKGAAEILLAQSSKEILDGVESLMSEDARREIESTINAYAKKSLRTIAMVYQDFEKWPPLGSLTLEDDKSSVEFEDVFQNMTFLCLVGIQDPLREGVADSVRRCQNAGIVVRMVTGDNSITAQAIATECGIKTDDGIAMEGPKFRQLSERDMDAVLPRLQVLARSSPEDKRILVARLKSLGETVAVTGDGTNDAPALKTADIGFSMGIAGTEVAKEASSIILMDDNFSSIVKAVMWGRAVNDAVSKFLQFQITVNITAVLLAFVSAVSSPDMHSVLTAVQLLWVNLIMDTFAALALATDPPTPEILDRKPTPKRAPLISVNMWKMILGQAVYQLIVTFILYYSGAKILGYDMTLHSNTEEERDRVELLKFQLNTIVFNTFVWMQIFNEFNNRRLDNKFNIFEGVHRNWFFIGINCIMVGGQVMIIFVGGAAFQVTRLDGVQWAVCILCAIFCLPWAVVLRTIPDRFAEIVINFTVKIFGVVFDPVGRAFGRVFHILNTPFRGLARLIRAKTRRERRDSTEMKATNDEESAVSPTTSSGGDKAGSPLSPPPITITTTA